MAVCYLVGEELRDPSDGVELTLNIQVDMVITVVAHPEHGQSGPQADDQELKGEDRVQKLVHKAHEVGHFRRCFLLIHHDLRLVSHINAHTVAVGRVFEGAAAE